MGQPHPQGALAHAWCVSATMESHTQIQPANVYLGRPTAAWNFHTHQRREGSLQVQRRKSHLPSCLNHLPIAAAAWPPRAHPFLRAVPAVTKVMGSQSARF
jgi:hypothetical protein